MEGPEIDKSKRTAEAGSAAGSSESTETHPEPGTRGAPAVDTSLPEEPDENAINSKIFNLAWPAITEMLMQTVTQIVDMIMVGQLGPAAIAAIGIANQPCFFVFALFQALAVGSTAVVARLVGAGDEEGAGYVMKQSTWLAVLVAVAASLPLTGLARPIVEFMGAEPEVIPHAVGYFRIVMGGICFNALAMVLIAVLRGAGDTRSPMIARIIANLLNILLNWLLIFGVWIFPEFGVMGAGLATVISRVVTAGIIIWVILRGKTVVRWRGRIFPGFDRSIIARIINVGLPAAGEQFVMRTGQLLFVRTVAGMGTLAMAAHQIAINIESVSFMPGFGFSVASTTLVGQYLGAKRPRWSERAGNLTAQRAVLFMGAVGVLLFLLGPSALHLYTDDPTVINLGTTALRVIAVVQPAMAMSFTMGGGLRGAGDTRFVLLSTAVGVWAVRLVLAYILGVRLEMGLFGAWLGMAADQCIRALLTTVRFRRGQWKKIKV